MRLLTCLNLTLFMMLPNIVWAGDHRALCEKVALSHHVIEVEFQIKGRYPKSARAKGWGPPESTLERIKRSGRVVQVFKGDLTVNERWNPQWDVRLSVGRSSVSAWDTFFRQASFRRVVFLQKPSADDGRWETPGWAEESARCGGKDSNHRSWCPGYDIYKAAVVACVSASTTSPEGIPPAMLASVCAHPCSGAGSRLVPWRNEKNTVRIVQVQGGSAPCSHQTLYFDVHGQRVLADIENSTDAMASESVRQTRTALLDGLTASEPFICPPTPAIPVPAP